MGARGEKYARRLLARMEEVEARMDAVERQQMDSDRYISGLQELSGRYLDVFIAQRGQFRSEVRDALKLTRRWKINAILMAVLLVLSVACCIICASAEDLETHQDGPTVQAIPTDGSLPGDDTPALVRCSMTEEEVEQAENEMIEAALLARSTRLDDVTVTHYCTCLECCGKDDGITASGLRATPGVTVAVDPDVIPLGADVLVDYGDGEIHYMRADDTGSGVKGNHIDVCLASHEEAVQAGVTTATVWWVMPE